MKISQEGELFVVEGTEKELECCKCSKIIQIRENGFLCKVVGKQRIFCEECQTLENTDTYNNMPAHDTFCKIALIKHHTHSHIKFQRR